MFHTKECFPKSRRNSFFIFSIQCEVWNGLVMAVIAPPLDVRLRLECDKRGCTALLNSKMPPATSKPILVNFISNPLVICHCLWILQSIFSIKMSSCLLNSFIPLAFMTFLEILLLVIFPPVWNSCAGMNSQVTLNLLLWFWDCVSGWHLNLYRCMRFVSLFWPSITRCFLI